RRKCTMHPLRASPASLSPWFCSAMCPQPDGAQGGGAMAPDAGIGPRMELLHGWLARRLGDEQLAWLDEQARRITAEPNGRALITAIGLASRRVGKDPLTLQSDEAAAAARVRPGLDA